MKRYVLGLVVLCLTALLLFGCGEAPSAGAQAHAESQNCIFTDSLQESIKSITFHNPSRFITVTKREDMDRIYEVLQSLTLRELTLSTEEQPDGFAFIIDIETEDGTQVSVSCLDGKIASGKKWYGTEQEYLPGLSELYKDFSKDYPA